MASVATDSSPAPYAPSGIVAAVQPACSSSVMKLRGKGQQLQRPEGVSGLDRRRGNAHELPERVHLAPGVQGELLVVARRGNQATLPSGRWPARRFRNVPGVAGRPAGRRCRSGRRASVTGIRAASIVPPRTPAGSVPRSSGDDSRSGCRRPLARQATIVSTELARRWPPPSWEDSRSPWRSRPPPRARGWSTPPPATTSIRSSG